MCWELIRVGRGTCKTIVGLEFGLIYVNPLALHFSMNFHAINANNIHSYGQNIVRNEGPCIPNNLG
jgi:hypothetical protein